MSEVNVLCIYMDWYSSTLVVSWLSVYSFFGQLRQYFENRMLDHLIYFEVDLSLLFVFIFYYSNHILLYVMIWAEKYPLSRYKHACLPPAYLFVFLSVCLSTTHVKISHLVASLLTSRQQVVPHCLSQVVNKFGRSC